MLPGAPSAALRGNLTETHFWAQLFTSPLQNKKNVHAEEPGVYSWHSGYSKDGGMEHRSPSAHRTAAFLSLHFTGVGDEGLVQRHLSFSSKLEVKTFCEIS